MFKLIRKMIGFETKDLYLAELGIYKEEYAGVNGTYKSVLTGRRYPNIVYNIYCYSFKPPKYIICKKESLDEYVDIFTGSKYKKYDGMRFNNNDILVKNLEPVISNKSRIKYKDAENVLEEKNTLCIKR